LLLSALLERLLNLEPAQDRGRGGLGGRRASDRAGILATRYAAGAVRLRLVQAEQLWVVTSDGNSR
jgi:hypothetical protein